MRVGMKFVITLFMNSFGSVRRKRPFSGQYGQQILAGMRQIKYVTQLTMLIGGLVELFCCKIKLFIIVPFYECVFELLFPLCQNRANPLFDHSSMFAISLCMKQDAALIFHGIVMGLILFSHILP